MAQVALAKDWTTGDPVAVTVEAQLFHLTLISLPCIRTRTSI